MDQRVEQWMREAGFRYDLRLFTHDEMLLVPRKAPDLMYHIVDDLGNFKRAADSEQDAIYRAEALARDNPGKTFYVTKKLAKSVVSPTPVTTTRL